MPQTLKDFWTISSGISALLSLIQLRSMSQVEDFFFPSGVYSSGPLMSKYFHLTFSLNGLFRQRLSGWRTRVSPPGITVTSMVDDEGDSSLVRWPRKESHTRSNFSLEGLHWRQTLADPLLNTFLVHQFFLPERNLHKLGTIRSLGVRTPLKTTLDGSFVPSAATARATEKLCFSAPHELTWTERLPLNSSVRVEANVRRAWSQEEKLLFALLPCAWLALA